MNTVTIPVTKKDHHAQFLATPASRTNPVTKLGVSAENVVATMDTPSSHHGIDFPAKKYSSLLLPADLDAAMLIKRTTIKKTAMISQSNEDTTILKIQCRLR